MIDNQRTVTIKMTRGEALRLCRLIINSVVSSPDEYDVLKVRDLHDKVRAAVDKLDQQEPEDAQTKAIRRMK